MIVQPALRRLVLALSVASTAAAAPGASLRPEILSTRADQTRVAVTIYNSDLALVKDARTLALPAGDSKLAWREVSAHMRPETALLSGDARVIEQNFDFDLLTPATLLDKYLGREVEVIRVHPTTGAETRERATVLATGNGVVLKFADRIETGAPGRLAFADVPATLRDRPTLVLSLSSPRGGDRALELSYLTSGLSWRADYVAELAADEASLDLSGWVTLTNQSGAAYPNAKLQLVAGDVNRVAEPAQPAREFMAMAKVADTAMAEESLLDYHLYSLPRPTDIQDNQTKQVALLAASRVVAKKDYVLDGAGHYFAGRYLGAQKQTIGVWLEFANKGDGLGVPLPRGVVRVYKQDRAGRAQFVGEDRIDHTPRNETVRLKLGEAFDLTAERTQTDYRKLAGGAEGQIETATRIVLKNARDEAATVTVREPIPGDWTIVDASHRHDKVAAHLAEWKLAVPASGEAVLTYRVRLRP